MRVDIWTDGSCSPNPGNGGWAAILESDERRKEIMGSLSETTNIRAEITAAIMALKALKDGPHEVLFHTDSDYVRGAIEGMKKAKANLDLIAEIDELKSHHQVTVIWTKGHANDKNNNRCDALAKLAGGF